MKSAFFFFSYFLSLIYFMGSSVLWRIFLVLGALIWVSSDLGLEVWPDLGKV